MSNIKKAKYKYGRCKNNKRSVLDVNSKGFLCSCNNREKECIRESYNLLNKYADMIYPPQNSEEGREEKQGELSVEDELENELRELKSEKKHIKRFQVVESGAKNFLFISTTLDDPVTLAHSVVSDLQLTKSQQTRFLIRLVPIEVTCKAYIKDIESAFEPLANKYFKESPKTFSIVYNHRNNNNLIRDEVIKAVAEIVAKANSDNKVDLKSAEFSVVIEVIKGIVLIGVVPDYIKFKKYNLLSICENEKEDKSEALDDKLDGEKEAT